MGGWPLGMTVGTQAKWLVSTAVSKAGKNLKAKCSTCLGFFQIHTQDVKLIAALVYTDQGLKKQPDKISRDHPFSLGSLGRERVAGPSLPPWQSSFLEHIFEVK